MKKILAIVLSAVMVFSLAACTAAPAGATSEEPKAEAKSEAKTEAKTETKTETKAEDDKITIAMVPQIKGNGYFTACDVGAQEAAKELGIDYIYDGPTDGRVDRQIELIDTFIADGVDAILVSPNDSDTIIPVLQKAMDAGIAVITFDVDANGGARDFFANPADSAKIGGGLIDCIVKQVGSEEFDYLMLCESLADAGQKSWSDAALAYAQEKYPGMNFLEIKQCTQNQDQAYTTAKDLLKVYPDVKGIVTFGSVCFPGVVEAVNDAGLKGIVAVDGMGTPNEVRSMIEDDSVIYDVLWNPVDLGYSAIYAAYNKINGTLKQGDKTASCGKLGDLEITENNEIMLGEPFIFTKENINDFDF